MKTFCQFNGAAFKFTGEMFVQKPVYFTALFRGFGESNGPLQCENCAKMHLGV